ncbi:MAG: 2-C-methyl-D-erythritol 2,4-cyclodiphosphate synthase [Gammaproteobacteria bacterium]|nr:2-C-methyl-D-erythritol 2,4-cyclodiphosphate synthase [Gammaproteobacteria bacterium]MDE2346441.1 2-C-methyl-D-erythritol 2,4-cyclodiphosphate synthase [Gammaproteobacteria bacterium]
MRIGQGLDVHAFGPGREIVLGGVHIPHRQGIHAHSDGDVLLHALCDALLGAAGLGDIGRHFPDTDPQNKGIDSRRLLAAVAALVREAGLRPVNVDATVIAQEPRLAPHAPAMCANIAADLAMPVERVNIKATTTERLGFIGRGEGIAALVVVLLEEN